GILASMTLSDLCPSADSQAPTSVQAIAHEVPTHSLRAAPRKVSQVTGDRYWRITDQKRLALSRVEKLTCVYLADQRLPTLDRDSTVNLSPTLVEVLEGKYAFVDLEVDSQDQIYRAGVVYCGIRNDYRQGSIHGAVRQLTKLRQLGDTHLCGHNFRRFDYPYLVRQYPGLGQPRIVDTLELSVLAFPLQPHHRLAKDYKLSAYAANNPVEDATCSRLLLHTSLAALLSLPAPLLYAYAWLLTCGTTDADDAYRTLFNQILGLGVDAPPTIDALPTSLLGQVNSTYLHDVVSLGPTYPVASRLCLACFLAWKDAFTRLHDVNEGSLDPHVYSEWLSRLPPFPAVQTMLSPVSTSSVALRHYLDEFGLEQLRYP